MDSAADWERSLVINELMQGYEFAKQLRNQFVPSSHSEILAQKVLTSITKALSMLKSSEMDGETQPTGPTSGVESPLSGTGSPLSENSNHPESREISKKRKATPKWMETVRVSAGSSLEGPPDDGNSWRKYGQKDILGATYPRSYYRCTHRKVQGCQAKKQVQRSEEDPSVFHVVYQDNHTCLQATNLVRPSRTPEIQEQQEQQQPEPQPQLLLNFRTGLKVKTEDLDRQGMNSTSFSFPPALINSTNPENFLYPSSPLDNNFMGSFSPPFISPATSESNYFSVSPCHMSSYGGGVNFNKSESDLNEIFSAVTSASNSSLVDIDFALDPIDPNLQFDTSTILS